MIITDAPKSPPKATTPLLGADGAGGSGAPPPAYAPRSTGPTPIGAQVPYAVYQPVYAQQQRVGGQSAARRFCMAFLVALGIWILVSALFGSIVDGSRLTTGRNGGYGGYPVPPAVDLDECLKGWPESSRSSHILGYPYSSDVSLDVPLPSETLLLLAKGAISSGNLKITSSSELTDVARVNIVVHYHATAVRDTVEVCHVKRKAGESGVGIFTPRDWWNRRRTDRVYFEVQLTLPRGSSINGFTTDVDNFSHDFDTLMDVVNFGHIYLKGSNGKIHAKALGAANATIITSNGAVSLDYLVADTAAVRSSNSAISGTYQVSETLELTTSNGAIRVTVGINGTEVSQKALIMSTSNNALDAVVNLDTTSGTGGKFFVKAQTSNGRLTPRIASAPLDSALVLHAKTSNAQGSVVLPATYEGSILVATSNSKASIQRVNSHEQDPACRPHSGCKGRTRTIEAREASNVKTEVAVFWDRKNIARGAVTLQSSNGPLAAYI